MKQLLNGFLSLTFVVGLAAAQRTQQRPMNRFFVEPQESVLRVVMHQPESPLQFEEVTFLHHMNDAGGLPGFDTYRVQNRARKPIVAAKIAAVFLNGGGGSLTDFRATDRSEWIMPGQRYGSDTTTDPKIVPLTDELRVKYRTEAPMKTVVFFLVVRVELADGSVYDNEKAYRELRALCEAVSVGAR